MKRLINVEPETEGGRYEIFRNGKNTGIYHNQPHTASLRIVQMKIDEPDAEFYYEQTIRVTAVAEFKEYEEFHIVGESETATFETE